MGISSYEMVLRIVESLPREEQLRLIREVTGQQRTSETTSVMDLCGLGQEIWQGVDAQEYVSGERSSWNG